MHPIRTMAGFIGVPCLVRPASTARRHGRLCMTSQGPSAPDSDSDALVRASVLSRRELLGTVTAAAAGVALSGVSQVPSPSHASVSFDTDRFGDKELKVAAINSIKQSCRNLLSERPELLPQFFVLCLHDALSFDAETLDGGPNGSLRFELDRPENAELRDAVEALTAVKQARRDSMSFADVFAFAGAVAMEVTNGPRIVIQLGREDAVKEDPPGKGALYKPGASAEDLISAFQGAGLDGARDVVLMHGAFGSLNDIAQTRLAKLQADAQRRIEEGDDVDDDEEGGFGDDSLDDVTYGQVTSKKRGAVLVSSNVSNLTLGGAKFSNEYLKFMVNSKKMGNLASLSERDRALLGNAETAVFVEQYANNPRKFIDSVGDVCEKISLLGSNYQSLKFSDG